MPRKSAELHDLRLRVIRKALNPAPGLGIRLLRVHRRLTQQQLADRAGVGQTSLSRWERGDCAPRPENLERLLDALGKK